MQTLARRQEPQTITVRPMREADVTAADRIMRVAFGTYLGAPDPVTVFGDADYVRTRFLAAPDCAWTAEIDGEVVGSNLATRWGSFAFFGPLTVRADLQDRGIGSRLMEPVVEAFESWSLRQVAPKAVPLKRPAAGGVLRLHAEGRTGVYRVEKRVADNWQALASFSVNSGQCKAPEAAPLPEPPASTPEAPAPAEERKPAKAPSLRRPR